MKQLCHIVPFAKGHIMVQLVLFAINIEIGVVMDEDMVIDRIIVR